MLASGSGDTYAQFRAGQSFNLEGLPNGRYYVAVEANPLGHLVESRTDNNVSLRQVRIGGTPEHRTVTMAQVGVIEGFVTSAVRNVEAIPGTRCRGSFRTVVRAARLSPCAW